MNAESISFVNGSGNIVTVSNSNPLPVSTSGGGGNVSIVNGGNTAAVDANGALLVLTEDATNYGNTTLTNGTVTNGAFSSGTVTNPAANAVILGPIDTKGADQFVLQLTVTSGSNPTLLIQGSDSSSGPWTSLNSQFSSNTTVLVSSAALSNNGIVEVPCKHRYVQIVNSATITGVYSILGYLRDSPFTPTLSSPTLFNTTVTAIGNQSSGNQNSFLATSSRYLIVAPYTIPEAQWQFSTAGTPITTATTTQIVAAGGASVRNYLIGLQVVNNSTTGTEIQILDGATIIWDGYVGSNTTQDCLTAATFTLPLRGTANTTMSIKTLTAGASIYVSAQGYTAF